MQGKDNIENLLRKSADNLASEFQDDWGAFDKKLSQAKGISRLKKFSAGITFAAAVVFLFMLFNSKQMFWDRDFYTPRTQDVVFDLDSDELPSEEFTNSFKEDLLNNISFINHQEKEDARTSSPNPKELLNNSINSGTPKNKIKSNSSLNSMAPVAVLSQPNTPISSPLDDEEGPLVSQAEEIALIDRDENPIEELLFLSSKRGFGSVNPSTGLVTNSTANDKYLAFEIEGLSSKFRDSDINLPLKSPIRKIDFSKGRKGPYISPLQAENAWSYSINMYPNYTFRKFELDADKGNLLHADFADAVQAAESGGLSLNLGLEINRRIAPVTYLNTGIEYISYKTEVLYNFTNFRDPIINKSNGFIDGYTIKSEAERVSFSDKNIYHYVNLPFSISYQPWASDHVRLNIEAGVSYLYFMTANGQTLDYKTLDVVDLSQRDFRNSMGSLSMKIGANYYVNERINVGFEPTLMYFTNTIYEDDYPFYVIPYSVGLNFNLQVKLN